MYSLLGEGINLGIVVFITLVRRNGIGYLTDVLVIINRIVRIDDNIKHFGIKYPIGCKLS